MVDGVDLRRLCRAAGSGVQTNGCRMRLLQGAAAISVYPRGRWRRAIKKLGPGARVSHRLARRAAETNGDRMREQGFRWAAMGINGGRGNHQWGARPISGGSGQAALPRWGVRPISGARQRLQPRWEGIVISGVNQRLRPRWAGIIISGARGSKTSGARRPHGGALRINGAVSHHPRWSVEWISQKIKAQACAAVHAGGQMLAVKRSASRVVGGRNRHPGRAARQIAGIRGHSRHKQAGLRSRRPALRWVV
jgi:hypothetical protein